MVWLTLQCRWPPCRKQEMTSLSKHLRVSVTSPIPCLRAAFVAVLFSSTLFPFSTRV